MKVSAALITNRGIVCIISIYKKRCKALPALQRCEVYGYSMTFGKVSTFASDTHWVTAAS